ncbi:MAG: hypothetical protein H6936_12585 [Burkholderiales bacterium]|nr:hypothetical protein [Nitrosomonas sp.]MCP5275658.1 hypothetical protein [Burkholderiales bacterium]
MKCVLKIMNRFFCTVFAISLLYMPAVAVLAGGNIIRVIDFTGQADGDAVSWLEKQGFEFELNAKKLNPRFENDALVLSTGDKTAGLFGLRFAQQDFIHGVKRVEIVWGVNKYPEGADWDNGINSVPIAVMLSFGTEKLSSGLPLGIKSAPYFLSPFIGQKEAQDKMYLGKLWREGGRYFCVASGDQSGKTITTDFEVDERFKSAFNHDQTPPITALAFQKNTNNTHGGSEAFIKKITFLSE